MALYTLIGSSTMTLDEGTLASSPITVTAVVATEDRADSPNTVNQPTYYIQITHDINSHLEFEGAGSGDNNDDAWGLTAIALAKVTTSGYSVPSNVSYNLGASAATGNQNVGTITIKDNTDGNDALKDNSNFHVQADFTLNVNGSYEVALSITGSDYDMGSVALTDDFSKAQVVHWDFEDAPTVTQVTADNFNLNTLTASGLEGDSDIASEIASDQASSNAGSVFSNWTLDIPAVTKDNESQLARIAVDKTYSDANVNTTSGSLSLFAQGEKLVVSGANIGGSDSNQIKLNYKLNGSSTATAVAEFTEDVSFVLVQA